MWKSLEMLFLLPENEASSTVRDQMHTGHRLNGGLIQG